MYEVSQAYINAMHQSPKKHRIFGTIDNVTFSNQNVLKKSMSISNKCAESDNDDVRIGYANIGVLNITFRNVKISKKTWRGRVVKPIFSMLIDSANDIWEEVPLGEFTIDSVQHTQSGVVVRAYDNMSKFTKSCGTIFSNATPYDILSFACIECGVELGNSQLEIESMPNGSETLMQYPESDIETWQDMLYWIVQTLGGFTTAGRDGKIYVRQYNQTVVDTLSPRHRHEGCSFSDFETRYTGINVVNMEDETTTYYGLETDDGLSYNLGSNPFLQYGTKEQIERRRRAVLQALTMIDYTPFKALMMGNPAYDLGDVIKFEDGIADGTKMCCITNYTFQFHQQLTMSGAGKDPATASAKSKTDKNIDGLINKVNKDTFRYDVIRNGREVDVSDQDRRRILRASLLTNANAQVEVKVEVLLNVEVAGDQDEQQTHAIGSITYQLDSELLERNPVETWDEGKHILTLIYMLNMTEPGFHVFDIFLEMDGGSASIDKYDILCIFSGIGMAATQGFNGLLEIEEEAPTFVIPQVRFANDAIDDVVINLQAPEAIRISDTASAFAIPQVGLNRNMAENIRLVRQLNQSTRVTEDGTVRVTEDGDARYTEAEDEEE